MKRKEAVDIIKDFLADYIELDQDFGWYFIEDSASELLKGLENLGMLPPDNGKMAGPVNEWEDE